MIKKEDTRAKLTKEKIRNALMYLLKRKSFNDIYVKDICTIACINRSSFYEHYQDINDLMIQVEGELSKQVASFFSDIPYFSRESFIKLFDFIKINAEFYTAFLTNREGSFMDMNDFKSFIPKMSKDIDVKSDYSENEIIYHMAFFAAGLSAICKAWLMNGMKETPEQMAEILLNEYSKKTKFFN